MNESSPAPLAPATDRDSVPFVKMHGLGNDYVYLDEREGDLGDPILWAPRLADRNRGIGGDGIIILRRDPELACRMEMYNLDGSRAEMCGNGIRCVARLAWERGYTDGRRFAIGTDSGIRETEITGDGESLAVRVEMGPARIEDLETRVEVEGGGFEGTVVDLGNPHFVIEIDGPVADYPVTKWGPLIEVHPRFPDRVNVEFVRTRGRDQLDFRVWERGSGETWACGTGATAAAAALHRRGRLDSRVNVHLRGGDLEIEVADDGRTWMTGPATPVFSGTFSRKWADG